MNSDSQTIKILLRIWVAALFINTLLGTAVITDLFTYAELIGTVAFLGLFYASVFTLPFVSLLLIFLRQLMRMELAGRKLFSYFFLTGLFLTMACFTIFFLMIGTTGFPIWSLLLIAVGSSAVAMLLEYRSITELGLKDVKDHTIIGL
jgi:uncharacterized membrane protein YbhN (UPF0104 family)